MNGGRSEQYPTDKHALDKGVCKISKVKTVWRLINSSRTAENAMLDNTKVFRIRGFYGLAEAASLRIMSEKQCPSGL